MIEVRKVRSFKEKRLFLRFPEKLYKGNPYYVPNLYIDEKNAVNHKSAYEDTTESEFFIALKDGKTVGRIQAIIQKAYNEMHNEKRIRFTRFDAIDSQEVADALFKAAEEYGREKGMDTICGPLGYSDFEREGLLIHGFDQRQTFEEQYNYDYYAKLIENYGFKKEIDWFESILRYPKKEDKTLEKLASRLLERNSLHLADTSLKKKKFLQKYGNGFFDCIDVSYRDLYGTVPFTPEMRRLIMNVFFPLIDLREICLICDKDEKVVSASVMFPGVSEAVQKSKGHLTPLGIIRLLRAAKHPKVLDLGLISVRPEYRNSGIVAVALAGMLKAFKEMKIDHMETNLNLETNLNIRNLWKRFDATENKKRRSYVKTI